MRFYQSAALFTIALLTAAATADDVPYAITAPGSFWGVWGGAKESLMPDPGVDGSIAERVVVSPQPVHPWDMGAYLTVSKPVKKDDVLLLSFWARAEKPKAGSDHITASGRISEIGSAEAGITPDTTFIFGATWQHYYIITTTARDYPPNTLNAAIQLGSGDQIIAFGPVAILDFGPNYDFSKPHPATP
jgi:hypothetical protein